MSVLGIVLVIAGVVVAFLVWRHDLERFRIGAIEPQGAPKRIAPEVHVISAGLTGFGVGLIWNSHVAFGAVAVQLVLAYAIMPWLLNWLAHVRPKSFGP